MQQSRLPKADSPRIIVDSIETKQKLIEIGKVRGETLKEIVIRLVEEEYSKINKEVTK